METALVTGATGFCGRHLVARLAREGRFRIVTLGRGPAPADGADEHLQLDLRQPAAVDRALRRTRPDVVFHLAGQRQGSEGELHALHATATLLLLETLRQHAPAARAVLVGSAAEYGATEGRLLDEAAPARPLSALGRSKLAMQQLALPWARRHGMRVVVSRPFNVVGAGSPPSLLIGAVCQRARAALAEARRTVRVGEMTAVRDFVAVADVVEGWLRLARGGAWGEVVNLCSGVPRRVDEVVGALLAFAPVPLVPAVDRATSPLGVRVCCGNPARALRRVGWRPQREFTTTLHEAWLASEETGLARAKSA